MSLTKVSYSMINGAPANVMDFGADPTGVADSLQAFKDAIASFTTALDYSVYSLGGTVVVPPGKYYLSGPLIINRNIVLTGVGSPKDNDAGISWLQFADNINGIVIVSAATSPNGLQGDGATIRNLYIERSVSSGGTFGSGIFLQNRGRIENCVIAKFRENGISIIANGGAPQSTNANQWLISSTAVLQNGNNGLYVNGPDTNAGVCIELNATGNTGWGIYDDSFLGNTYVGCHVDLNTAGAYKAEDPNARCVFLGCYSEPGQPASDIAPPSIMIGGLQGAGVTAQTLYIGASLSGVALPKLEINGPTIATSIPNKIAANISGFVSGYQGRATGGLSQQNFYANDGVTLLGFVGANDTSTYAGANTSLPFDLYAGGSIRAVLESAGNFRPNSDNAYTLGNASYRWSVVYAATGSINTSDARTKQDVTALEDVEKRVAVALKGLVKKFRFKDAVAAKGDAARIHVGVIAQDVKAAFDAEGLDAHRYGILCYDEWDAKDAVPAVLDADGNEVLPAQSAVEAGNRYGVRYEELLAFIIASL